MFDDVTIAQYAATKAKIKFSRVGNQRDNDAESGAAMNLMFWKKKTAPEDGAASQQEEPDGDEVLQNSSDDETADSPEKPGLMARLRSRFAALFSRSRKSGAAKDDNSEESGDEPGDEPGNEQSGSPDGKSAAGVKEVPKKPGLLARLSSKFSSLLGRFRKSSQKTAEADEHGQSAKAAAGASGKESQSAGDKAGGAEGQAKKTGLVEKLKPLLSSLGSKLMAAGSGVFSFLSEYLIYLLSGLAAILLVGLIYMARDIIFPPLVRKTTSSDPAKYVKPVPVSAPEVAPTLEPDPNASPQAAAEIFQKKSEEAKAKAEALIKEAEELQKKSEEAKAQAEALKKKEEEERAQAEALRKKQEEERASRYRNQSGSSGQQTTGGTKVMPGSNEWTAGSKDPKATAKTLKEAIEAMNAESSGNISRPTKPPGNP